MISRPPTPPPEPPPARKSRDGIQLIGPTARHFPTAKRFVLFAALLLLMPGCSTISAFNLHGPVNDEAVQVDMSRKEVERALDQSPNSMFQNPDGMFEARYDYVDGPSGWSKLRVLLYTPAAFMTLGLSELIFWPTEIQVKKRATRTALAEYSKDLLLASWQVKNKSGTMVASKRSSKYESYVLASKGRYAGGNRIARNGVDDAPPILAPANATTQNERIRFVVGLRNTTDFTALYVDGEQVRTKLDGTYVVNKIVPMGVSTIELKAIDVDGGKHLEQVSVTRWNPKSDMPSSLLAGNYYALVIGNDSYVSLPPLKTARADAVDVAAELENHYGYQVDLLLDATRHQVVSALSKYRNLLTSDDKLLVYYAGHGIEDKVESHGYWLPVDAESDDPSEWISNANITRQIKAMNANMS